MILCRDPGAAAAARAAGDLRPGIEKMEPHLFSPFSGNWRRGHRCRRSARAAGIDQLMICIRIRNQVPEQLQQPGQPEICGRGGRIRRGCRFRQPGRDYSTKCALTHHAKRGVSAFQKKKLFRADKAR